MPQIDFKKCTLKVKDGAGTPAYIDVFFGEGTITWTEHRPRKYITNRGVVSTGTVRDDDQQPMDVNLSASLLFCISASGEAITLYEAVNAYGAASGWTTTGAACEPYACDLQLIFDPACSPTVPEVYVFPQFRVESNQLDPKGGMITLNGKCKATKPTIVRTTAP